MKVKLISKYGFKTDENDNWNNYHRGLSKHLTKEDIGKDITFRTGDNGAVTQIVLGQAEVKPKTKSKSLLIKVITTNCPNSFEDLYNKFARDNTVKNTQTHFNGSTFVGILYYEEEI